MKILVTGGEGFIGSHLLERLVEDKHNPIVLVKDFRDIGRIKHLGDKIQVHNSSALEYVFERFPDIESVIHLAAVYRKDDDGSCIEDMITTNIEFPTKLLNAMVKRNVNYFINAGTFFEYQQSKQIGEFTKKHPFNLYASTKLAFEEILKYFTNNKRIKAVNLKLFSPYGPKDNSKLITSVCRALVNDEEIEVTKGEQKLSWTYVKDTADAFVKAIDLIPKMDSDYEDFNIGAKRISLITIYDILEKISGKYNLIKRTKPYSSSEIMNSGCVCNNPLIENLGWKPKVSIEDGLNETYKYYLNEKNNEI